MEYVGLHTEQTYRVAFVLFRDANDARRASVFTVHTIAGNVVNVKMADTVVHPPNLLSMPDDCLLDIMRIMELKDLCSVAGACKRFNDLAKMVFKTKWKDLRLTISHVQDLHECLRRFGSEIQSICIMPSIELPKSHYNSVLSALVQHCSGTLSSLEMHNFTFEMNYLIMCESRPLFVGLKKLILHKSTISVKWFILCRELVELQLFETHVTFNGAQYQVCPKLEILKIYGSKSWVDYGLHLFLDQNNQLKTLEVLPLLTSTNRSYASYGDILYCVPRSIENLTIVPTETTRLDHFVSLKTLRIAGNYVNNHASLLINKLQNATIEHLEIDLNHFGIDQQNAETIANLKNLSTLKMHVSGGCVSGNLLHMVENLNGLTDLVLSSHTNMLTAFHICVMLEHSSNLQRLCLSFAYNGDDGNKLQINEHIYHSMLNAVLRRTNGKSLCIVIVGCKKEITQIDVSFRMHSALKLVSLPVKTVASMNCKKGFYLQKHIKMTDDVFNELRARGLCP